MKLSLSSYCSHAFNYDREHITKNKVAIEAYKVLIYFAELNSNCRVGTYLSKGVFSEFYPLKKIIPSFDLFCTYATGVKGIVGSDYQESIEKMFGVVLGEQIELIYLLKYPIWFEFTTRNSWGNIFGYNFDSAFRIKIDPNDINELQGIDLGNFSIKIKDYTFMVKFKNQIRVE